jgi:hypothetical protein
MRHHFAEDGVPTSTWLDWLGSMVGRPLQTSSLVQVNVACKRGCTALFTLTCWQ